MTPTYTKEQIRAAFAKWYDRAKGQEFEQSWDPDESTDYLVELMEEEPEPNVTPQTK